MTEYRNFLVIHKTDITIDTFKVIDAWSTTGNVQDAMETMTRNIPEYKAKYGNGKIELVEQDGNSINI